MKPWQLKKTTIPPQETPQGHPSQPNNENTGDAQEVMVKALIGQTLNQVSLLCALANLQRTAVQSNLATPKTEAALSFALWVMANHLTSTLDQLRTLIFTLPTLLRIIPSKAEAVEVCDSMQEVIDDVCWDVFGEPPEHE